MGIFLIALVSSHAQTTFTKITTGAIVTDKGASYGGTWGDYNNDGFLDLFVFNESGGPTFPFLYSNNVDGTFTKITSGPPVSTQVDSPAACWGDYDNDGNLDLFVATHSVNLLYHNNGDGAFSRITTGPLVTGSAYHEGAAWGDYDNDGFLDLFVTVFVNAANAHNSLYRNNGDGTFTQITNGSPVTDIGSSLGCTWVDYDNDGHDDLLCWWWRA